MSKTLLIDENILKGNIRAVIEEIVDEFWTRRIANRAANLNVPDAVPQTTKQTQTFEPQSMNERELQSIYDLFAWVAEEQDMAQERVQCITEARFNVDNVVCLPRKDYDEVIRFLVDLRIDELRN